MLTLSRSSKVQPQEISLIDWKNPITRGLVGAYIGTSSAPQLNLASLPNKFTPSGAGASLLGNPYGMGYQLNGASYLQDQNFPDVVTATGRTMLALVNPASLPASNANVTTWTSTNTVHNIEQLSILNTGQVRAETYRNGSAGPATTTGSVTLNKWQMIGAIMYAGDLSRSACLDTEIATVVSSAGPILAPANWLTMGYAPWAVTDYFTGGIALSLIWGRQLMIEEYLSIVNNPWQIFPRDRVKQWVGISGAAPVVFPKPPKLIIRPSISRGLF